MEALNHPKSAEEAVEIWFSIQKDDEGYPQSQDWEELWASPVQGCCFRVESTPFFAKEIASGDVVSAVKTDGGVHRFERVVSRSGHSNFRIWLRDGLMDRESIIRALGELGCRTEVTLERLIAIDVSPDHEPAVWKYLEAGRDGGAWGLQVGFSPD